MKYTFILLIAFLIVACSKTTDVATLKANDGTNGHDGTDGRNGYSVVSMQDKASALECETDGQRLDLYLDLDYSLTVSEGDRYMNSLVVCDGNNGINGIDGVNGQNGEDGQNGLDGAEGPEGQQGPQGLIGAAGPQGLMGPQGLQGPVGSPGLIGPQGVAGLTGPRGPQGAQGPQGIQGPVGSSGATITHYAQTSCTKITGSNTYMKVQGQNVQFFSSNTCKSSTKLSEVSQGESFWVTGTMLAVYDDSSVRVINFN